MKFICLMLPVLIFSACSAPAREAAPGAISVEEAGRIVAGATTQAAATVQRQIAIESTADARTEIAFRATLGADKLIADRTQAAINIVETERANGKTATVETFGLTATSAALGLDATAAYYQRVAVEEANARADSYQWLQYFLSTLFTAWLIGLVTILAWITSVAARREIPRWRIAVSPPLLSPPESTTDTTREEAIDGEAEEIPPLTHAEQWQEFYISFCEYGEQKQSDELSRTLPFSVRRFELAGLERGDRETVGSWEWTTNALMVAGVLRRMNGSANARAWWATDMSMPELRRKIRILPLPYPEGHYPPAVKFRVPEHTHAQETHAEHTIFAG